MNYKLSVDSYTEDFDNDTFHCECFIIGCTKDTYDQHQVTIDELKASVCEPNGKVSVAVGADDSRDIDFWDWYRENRYSSDMNYELACIINKREGRKLFPPMPDVFGAVTSIN